MINKYVLLASLVCFSLCFTSCEEDDQQNTENRIEEGRQLQITNLYNNFITPQVESYLNSTRLLEEEAENFNANSTTISLANLKTAWAYSFLEWKKLEALNIGAIQENFIYPSTQQWPINSNLIENTIGSDIIIDSNYIASIGALGKGYSSIEYLLFEKNETETFAALTSDENHERRIQYLLALTQNLETLALELKLSWQNYENNFKTELETSVSGSQNRIINAFIANLEFIKNTKIEEALNSMEISSMEAYRSRLSKQAISANIASLKNIYTGNFIDANGFGVEEYLRIILQNNALADKIDVEFSALDNALLAITNNLEDTLSENIEAILNFQSSLSSLIVLYKVDLASAANVIITFNDNDGD